MRLWLFQVICSAFTPKSTMGTSAYSAPEVLMKKEYNGKKILGVQYVVPDYVHISPGCLDLISRIFVSNPDHRITMPQIKSHPWFVKNLPIDLADDGAMSYEEPDQLMQNMNDIMQILAEATIPAVGARATAQLLSDGLDMDEDMEDLHSDLDLEDIESSGELNDSICWSSDRVVWLTKMLSLLLTWGFSFCHVCCAYMGLIGAGEDFAMLIVAGKAQAICWECTQGAEEDLRSIIKWKGPGVVNIEMFKDMPNRTCRRQTSRLMEAN